MSEYNTHANTIHRVELIAIIISIIAVVFIFIFRIDTGDQDREVRNAIRYQDISVLADTLWKLSLESPEFTSQARLFSDQKVTCESKEVPVDLFEELLVPEYINSVSKDPSGESYFVGFLSDGRIQVCSLFGEKENGQLEVFSITR